MQRRANWNAILQSVCSILIFFFIIFLLLSLLTSCSTARAIMAAPEEFYITLDLILAALLADVMALIDLLL